MKTFANLSIGTKLSILPVIAVVTIMAVSLIGGRAMLSLSDGLEFAVSEAYPEVKDISEIDRNVTRVHQTVYRLLSWSAAGVDEDRMNSVSQELDTQIEEARQSFVTLLENENLTDAGRQMSVDAQERFDGYLGKVNQVLGMLDIDYTGALSFSWSAQSDYEALTDILSKLRGTAELRMDSASGAAMAVGSSAQNQTVFAAIFASVAMAVISFVIASLIGGPVKKLTQIMRELAEGKTDISVPYTGRKDEMGKMADAVGGLPSECRKPRSCRRTTPTGRGPRNRGKTPDHAGTCPGYRNLGAGDGNSGKCRDRTDRRVRLGASWQC